MDVRAMTELRKTNNSERQPAAQGPGLPELGLAEGARSESGARADQRREFLRSRLVSLVAFPMLLGSILAAGLVFITSSADPSPVIPESDAEFTAQLPGQEGASLVGTPVTDLANSDARLKMGHLADEGEDPRVTAQLKRLREEHLRLQAYEDQVRKRLQSLDSALQELDSMEMDSAREEAPAASRLRHPSRAPGIGGGDGPSAPMIHLGPSGTLSFPLTGTARRGAHGNAISSPVFGALALSPFHTLAAALGGSQASVAASSRIEHRRRTTTVVPAPAPQPTLMSLIDLRLQQLGGVPLGAPVQGSVSSEFGWRSLERSGGHLHQGIDLSVDQLSPVVATADGIVLDAGPKGAYGYCVVIVHRGEFETLYGHLARMTVKPGDRVCRGERIGYVGTTGRSTGPHLHYEVHHHGVPLNPARFIEQASFVRLLDGQTL